MGIVLTEVGMNSLKLAFEKMLLFTSDLLQKQ